MGFCCRWHTMFSYLLIHQTFCLLSSHFPAHCFPVIRTFHFDSCFWDNLYFTLAYDCFLRFCVLNEFLLIHFSKSIEAFKSGETKKPLLIENKIKQAAGQLLLIFCYFRNRLWLIVFTAFYKELSLKGKKFKRNVQKPWAASEHNQQCRKAIILWA